MAQFGSKSSIFENIWFRRVLVAVLLLIAAYLATAVFERYQVEREMAKRLQDAQTEYERLETRHDELNEKVEYLKGEEGMESEIRKHFDVAKEGEKVVIIVESEEEAESAGVPIQHQSDEASDRPWYRFW